MPASFEIVAFSDKDLLPKDDPQLFKDAPICIQVVGRTLEEEAVVAIGEIVDQALRVA